MDDVRYYYGDTEWVDSYTASKVLGASQVTVCRLCRRGDLPAVKMSSSRWIIQREVLDKFARTYLAQVGRPRRVSVDAKQTHPLRSIFGRSIVQRLLRLERRNEN